MTHEELKSIMDAAGIRPTEAAEIFHVSRSTVYEWYNGVEPKSSYLWDAAARAAEMVHRATIAGKLPVKDSKGKQRMFEIVAAMRSAAAGQI